ncbi:MAG: hypothetical protein IRY99_17540 [Isosphaeraceae bacterium]|nr:hypothetical protein [Isosphaeraceae bacterium]
MSTTLPRAAAVPALLLALLLAVGCRETGPPGAGLTNAPRPEAAEDKPALRTDLPPEATPDRGETVGQLGDNQTNAGIAGRGGGREGGYPEQPKPDQANDAVRATPPAIEAGTPGSAAGGTKPANNINTGTPRSPH